MLAKYTCFTVILAAKQCTSSPISNLLLLYHWTIFTVTHCQWSTVCRSVILQYIVKFISDVSVFRIIWDAWKCWDHGVLCTDVDCVIHFPVDVADFSRRMKQTL